jgi:uncharacterized protein
MSHGSREGITMSDREHTVAAVLSAAGGEMVGRVRLQKAVYLLDRLGLGSGFSFDYHHYGPFSRDLDNATADAKAFGLVEERFEQRQSDGATYSVFKLKEAPASPRFGGLSAERARDLVRRFVQSNVTVLELAATIDWLWREEGYLDWHSEVVKRKGAKVRSGRLEKAVQLLEELNMAPPAVKAA